MTKILLLMTDVQTVLLIKVISAPALVQELAFKLLIAIL